MQFDQFQTDNMFPDLHSVLTPDELLELLLSLPDGEQEIIRRVWDVHMRVFDAKPRINKLTRRPQLETYLLDWYDDHPNSLTSWDRAHRKYPMLAPWPIKRGMTRPWERPIPDISEVVLKPEDQIAAGQYVLPPLEAIDSLTGVRRMVQLVVRGDGHIRGTLLASSAAVASGFMLLDGMDGKVDHVVSWCRILAHAVGIHV